MTVIRAFDAAGQGFDITPGESLLGPSDATLVKLSLGCSMFGPLNKAPYMQ